MPIFERQYVVVHGLLPLDSTLWHAEVFSYKHLPHSWWPQKKEGNYIKVLKNEWMKTQCFLLVKFDYSNPSVHTVALAAQKQCYTSHSIEKLQKDLNNNSPHLGYRLHSK